MAHKFNSLSEQIVSIIQQNGSIGSTGIQEKLIMKAAPATVIRALRKLVDGGMIITEGQSRSLKYRLSPAHQVLSSINVETYFQKEVDERIIRANYNNELITDTLKKVRIFSRAEMDQLDKLQHTYTANIAKLTKTEYQKELERLAIDLSWKSSQIEGNTYSLLETEKLLIDKEAAPGKTKDEAVMLLNHKEAIDFIVSQPDYVTPVNIRVIEDIHSILVKGLGVDRNMRKHRVGISGTNYRPLDNEHQIREAMEDICRLVNHKDNVIEKALLLLVLISYVQPFADGNKRTARIISNAILISHQYCPVSFRTIDSVEYKKAMLIFYEQNNITAFKKIFINQFEFAVNTYF